MKRGNNGIINGTCTEEGTNLTLAPPKFVESDVATRPIEPSSVARLVVARRAKKKRHRPPKATPVEADPSTIRDYCVLVARATARKASRDIGLGRSQ